MAKIANYITSSSKRLQLPLAPVGTYVGVITAIREEFGVRRPKYNSPQETETVDLVTIFCGFKDSAGNLHFVGTAPLKLSTDQKSAFTIFVGQANGSIPWETEPNWDTRQLEGLPLQITIAHQRSQKTGRIYARMTSVAPLLAQFLSHAPALAEAQAALHQYEAQAAQQNAPRVVAPPGPPPNSPTWTPRAPLAQMPPSSGATIPTIQPPGTPVSQTNSAPAAGWPVNPASFAPPVFSGQPSHPALSGQAAPASPPTTPILPPTNQPPPVPPAASATPPLTGQPGTAPFLPTAGNPDVNF